MSDARAGFVLPLVAMTIAILAISALAFLQAGDGTSVRLRALQDQTEFERGAASAEARAAYLLLTEPLGAAGVRVGVDPSIPVEAAPSAEEVPRIIALDGRPYTVTIDGVAYDLRLQDEAGLLNLNAENTARLARGLQQIGIEAPQARRLADTLADYVDADDLRRAQGAERASYPFDAPPLNGPLPSVAATAGAADWAQALTSDQWFALTRLVAVRAPDAAFNPNTASRDALIAVLGADGKTADLIIRLRARQPIANVDDLAALGAGGLQLDGLPITPSPARTIRIAVRSPGHAAFGGMVYETSLVLAEPGATSPIAYGRRMAWVDKDGQSGDERGEPLPGVGTSLAR